MEAAFAMSREMDEPISPELVLVTPELRPAAIVALPEQGDVLALQPTAPEAQQEPEPEPPGIVAPPRQGDVIVLHPQQEPPSEEPDADSDAEAPARGGIAKLLLAYAAWQALVGVVFGAAAFAAFAALAFAVSLIAH